MNKNELIIQQAREDIQYGKITTEEFFQIKRKYGNHKRFTKEEYLNLPIFGDSDRSDGIYRKKDDKLLRGWCLLYNIMNNMDTNITIEIGEII